MAHLKYYIANTALGNQSVNSIACEDGVEPELPSDFVEWFNPDEWDYMPPADSASSDGTLNAFGGHYFRKKTTMTNEERIKELEAACNEAYAALVGSMAAEDSVQGRARAHLARVLGIKRRPMRSEAAPTIQSLFTKQIKLGLKPGIGPGIAEESEKEADPQIGSWDSKAAAYRDLLP